MENSCAIVLFAGLIYFVSVYGITEISTSVVIGKVKSGYRRTKHIDIYNLKLLGDTALRQH